MVAARSSPRAQLVERMTRDELLALPPTTDAETAGRAIGIGRALAYDLVRRGEFPVRTLRLGRRVRVPTADLLALLGEGREPEQELA